MSPACVYNNVFVDYASHFKTCLRLVFKICSRHKYCTAVQKLQRFPAELLIYVCFHCAENMLKAIYEKDLTEDETVCLTKNMRDSGELLGPWPPEWKGMVVDKHSTGGVGDKVSLILAPALAACGMKVGHLKLATCENEV